MTTEERFRQLLSATPSQLADVDKILDGYSMKDIQTPDRKLLTLADTARELGVSRMTVHRMCADKRLPVIVTRCGRRRIASADLTSYLENREK